MSPPLTMMRGASLKEARDFHIPQLVKHLYHARELVVAHRRLLGMVCEFCTGHWCFHFDPDAEYASLDRVVNCIDHMLWQCEDLPKSCVPCRVKHARKVAAHLGKTYSESAPWLCVGNSRRRGCDDLS